MRSPKSPVRTHPSLRNRPRSREHDNLDWNDLQMTFKVIKSGTDRKLVYDFLLEVCSNFAASRTVYEKFDVKESNDLEI